MFHNLNHFKSVAAHKHFATPADEDYLVARWALTNGFPPTFFWHAAQAIEKYLKACLLANETSTKEFNHRLNDLYEKYCEIYGALAVNGLSRPDFFPEGFWGDDTAPSFIGRLQTLGNPDSRYGLTGWNRRSCDLFKFDLLCSGLRRQVVGLDWIVGADFEGEFPAEANGAWTFRRLLAAKPDYSVTGPIKNLDWPVVNLGNSRNSLLHRWNYGFERFESDRRRAAPSTVYNRGMIPPFENSFPSRLFGRTSPLRTFGNVVVQRSFSMGRCGYCRRLSSAKGTSDRSMIAWRSSQVRARLEYDH